MRHSETKRNRGSGLIERAWNIYAPLYDTVQPFLIRLIGAFGDLSYDEFEEGFIELAQPKRGQVVLDIACGTGASHAALSSAIGDAGRIIAVDISSEMLRKAKSRAGRLKLRNIRYQNADAEKLSFHFDEDSFDMVLNCNGMPNFFHPQRALVEMAHVLKPGGSLAFSTINRERCDEILLWRWGLKYPKERFPYPKEYRELLEDLRFAQILFREQGLMLIVTARKSRAKRPGKKGPA